VSAIGAVPTLPTSRYEFGAGGASGVLDDIRWPQSNKQPQNRSECENRVRTFSIRVYSEARERRLPVDLSPQTCPSGAHARTAASLAWSRALGCGNRFSHCYVVDELLFSTRTVASRIPPLLGTAKVDAHVRTIRDSARTCECA